MKDIPVFTTENGVASLVLQEIPYTGKAYVYIRASEVPVALAQECASFCRAVGAEEVYTAGCGLEDYPVHCRVWEMRCPREQISQTDACLFPVTEKTLEHWRTIYNNAMKDIPNAAWMSERRAKELLLSADAYFVHENGELLGIGKASEGKLHAIAAVKKGCGKTVLQALCSVLQEEVIVLEVADTNERALHLYSKVGFVPTREITCWHTVKK